jgi:hypothetical protein
MVSIVKKGTLKLEIETIISRQERETKSEKSIAAFAGKLITELNPNFYQKKRRDEWL